MDTLFQDFPTSNYGFKFDRGSAPIYPNHNLVNNGFKDRGVSKIIQIFISDLEREIKGVTNQSPLGSRGRKSYQREENGDNDLGEEEEDGDEEEEEEGRRRRCKQSAISLEDSSETSQSEMFDDVLLCKGENEEDPKCALNMGSLHINNGGERETAKRRVLKLGINGVCLHSAHKLFASMTKGLQNANELLKQINQHSSDTGDGTQRMAYYFANAIKTRLAGMGAPSSPLVSNRTCAADVYLSLPL